MAISKFALIYRSARDCGPPSGCCPSTISWPPELDVFEVVGNTAGVTAHSASTGNHTLVSTAVATADLSDGFHTYGVNWQPDVIEWYIDGTKVAGTATPADMHKPMYMLANLAVRVPEVGQALPTRPHFPRR
jgi:beta-glucanase (GH16 family)